MDYEKRRKPLSEHGKLMDGENTRIHTARIITEQVNRGNYEKLVELLRATEPESQIVREYVADILENTGGKGRPKDKSPPWECFDIYWRVKELQAARGINQETAFEIVDKEIAKSGGAKARYHKGKQLSEPSLRMNLQERYRKRLESVLANHANNSTQIEFELHRIRIEGWLEGLDKRIDELKKAAKKATGLYLREITWQLVQCEIEREEIIRYTKELKRRFA